MARPKKVASEKPAKKDIDYQITSGEIVNNRYNFSVLIEAINSNPNGDPGNEGRARVNGQGYGTWSPQSLSYKIKTRIEELAKHKEWKGYKRFMSRGSIISESLAPYTDDRDDPDRQRRRICEDNFDIRWFGGMLKARERSSEEQDEESAETGKKGKNFGAGILHSAITIQWGKSIDPIYSEDARLIRVCATSRDRLKGADPSTYTEMGATNIVPYGLYRFDGSIDPVHATKNYFTESECDLLWKALASCLKHDASFTRSNMNVKRVVIWKHDSPLGNAPGDYVVKHLSVKRKEGVESAEKYEDYDVTVNPIKEGIHVTCTDMNEDEIVMAWND